MSKGRDEVEAAVDPVVLDVLPVEAALVPEVLLKLLLDVVCHRPPAANHTEHFQRSVLKCELLPRLLKNISDILCPSLL